MLPSMPHMSRFLTIVGWLCILNSVLGLPSNQQYAGLQPRDEDPQLHDIVTVDEHSISVHGRRVMLFSGEFHPFRLPSPGLWLDVFQKISAMGYTAVSFYVDWALVEGEQGHYRADGIFALEPFFDAAQEAGLYLIARPGPYINAETSGGGLPGWLQRNPALLRSTAPGYLAATEEYLTNVLKSIEAAQITHGGPVIMVQYENEYSISDIPETIEILTSLFVLGQALTPNTTAALSTELHPEYMADVRKVFEDAGIVVPLMANDAVPAGNWAPGSGEGAADIYAIDDYPFPYGISCADPTLWAPGFFPQTVINYTAHAEHSPTTPFSIAEFQGGEPEAWGGVGKDLCAAYINQEYERVIYKNNYANAVKFLNIYMTYGGTNWGNLGYPGGYTSYDSAAVVKEDRTIMREKYSEAKLQANFFRVSPAYLTSTPQYNSSAQYVDNKDITVTCLATDGNSTATNFFIVRHSDYASYNSTGYRLSIDTSAGHLRIPQLLNSNLTLNGRDSKVHVSDYDVGGNNLIYSSAEIFTWTESEQGTVLVLYGGEGETHEFALPREIGRPIHIEGDGVVTQMLGSTLVAQWKVLPGRRVVHFANGLQVHLLWRNDAYNYWTLHSGLPHEPESDTFIVKAGYLMRSAEVREGALYLNGDVNSTTTVEVIATPCKIHAVYFNEERLNTTKHQSRHVGTVEYKRPSLSLPDFSQSDWRYVDSLPEIQSSYDDSLWNACTNTASINPRNLTTPTSLYAGDYGYVSGSLIYRGHFIAKTDSSDFNLTTQGGDAFAHSVWLNETFLGSWIGNPANASYTQTLNLTALSPGSHYVLTVLIDHMGLEENTFLGKDTMKTPRGILDFDLTGHAPEDIAWKLTGNLGGEQYVDHARGPLNEGAMYAERQGYHLPEAPSQEWEARSPLQGISAAGVGYFYSSFDLDVPVGYDVPLSFVFGNLTNSYGAESANFRCQLFVNGYQFGKYVNNIGPQSAFPVPEGVLNHHGKNFVGITLWSLDEAGAELRSFSLVSTAEIMSDYAKPALSPQPCWEPRAGAY